MHRNTFLTFACLTAAAAATAVDLRAQSLGQAIQTPERSAPVINQTLTGTWLYELRRGGQPETQSPVLLLIQFHPDGSVTGSAADGTQSSHHGSWLRTGDRKFLITTALFSFNDSRAFTTIIKIRGNVQLGEDGLTAKGTQEVVLMDREGKVIATIPGGTFAGSRLAPEKASDFDDFQSRQ